MPLPGQAPRDAQTVPVNVQVIDLEPRAIDLILPAYLPASDLTQRIARDADLEAFWPDGRRRIFYLRARGRLMQPTERLQDLGVVPYELLHILPEPPEAGVQERPPEYPPNRGYAGAGNFNVAMTFAVMLAWTGAWSLALTVDQGWITGLFPGLGLSLICTSLARHMWGGQGSSVKIPVTGLAMFVPLWMLTPIPTVVLMSTPWRDLAIAMGPAVIAGSIGVMLGWLAWYGAVEPLPKVTRKEVQDAVANITFPCGICGGSVTQDVKADCVFGCGRVFHVGCYEHKRALSDASSCAVCGYHPA